MKKSFGEYRWLAGRGRYEGSLWLGGDYLLVIETSGFVFPYTESYRRIDFKNIQAISVATTKRGAALSVFMVAALVLLALGIMSSYTDTPGLSMFFGILAAPILIALIAHWVRGPTTTCKLQTAVQILKLKPLNRLKTAQRVMADLAPFCNDHQAALKTSTPPLPDSATSIGATPHGLKIKEPWPGSPLVVWSLVLVLISSIVSGGEFFIKGMPYYFMDAVFSVAAVCLVVAAAAKVARYRSPGVLLLSIWGNVLLTVISIVIAYGTMFFHIVKDSIEISKNASRAGGTEMSVWSQMADADIHTYGLFGWLMVGMSGLAFLLALMGLPAAGGRTRVIEKPPQIPPPPPIEMT